MTDYVTRAELQRMVDACPADTLAGKRDRLLLVVLRALNGRSRELTALRMDDIEITQTDGMGIFVRATDEYLSIDAGEYTDHAPYALFIEWISATTLEDHRHRWSRSTLFRAVTKDDRLRGPDGLSSKYVGQIVKRAATRAGLDNPERYNARCLRGPARWKVGR